MTLSSKLQTAEPRVGVGVLVTNSEGDVLLTLRKRAPEAGLWSIVGGKVEFMECLEDAARRETLEESGLHVELTGLLCVTDHLLPDERHHWVAPAYHARIVGGTLSNLEPDKTEAIRFFSLNALPNKLTLTAQRALTALEKTL